MYTGLTQSGERSSSDIKQHQDLTVIQCVLDLSYTFTHEHYSYVYIYMKFMGGISSTRDVAWNCVESGLFSGNCIGLRQ